MYENILHQSHRLATLGDFLLLPQRIGMNPRAVEVTDDIPLTVRLVVYRYWWQRLIPGHRRKWESILKQAIRRDKVAGIIVEVYVR